MEQWDWEANKGIDPSQVGLSSFVRASWICPEHGPWVTMVCNRAYRGSGCPECAKSARRGPRAKRGLLKDEHPEIFAQLHPTLNGDLRAGKSITSGSGRRLWWLCTEDRHRPAGCQHEHAWQARVSDRRQGGCPFCAGVRVCPCTSVARKEPAVLQFWHPSRNAGLSPD